MGTESGQLLHPTGLATNANGDIFVCDRDNHRLQMFDASGNFLALILQNTCKNGTDIRPLDCAISSNSHLVVLLTGVEGENFAQIQVLQCLATSTSDVMTQQLYTLRASLDSLCQQAPTPGYNRKTPLPPVRAHVKDERPPMGGTGHQHTPGMVAGHRASCITRAANDEKQSTMCNIL